jgi:protocatechuate 3,4-dioxygenase alpha subunit
VLALVPEDRRATLIAERDAGSGNAVFKLDLRLRDGDETVFFDV